MAQKLFLVVLFFFGGFLWGQEDLDRPGRDERIRAMWKEDQARVAAEIAKNQKDQADLIQQNLARTEAAIRASLARNEAATNAFIARQNSNWGGGRGGPLYHMPQDGAVAIGERVSPANDILQTGVDCVDKLTEKLGYKDAQAYCRDITREAMKTSGNVSRSARKAIKAPPILVPRYGW